MPSDQYQNEARGGFSPNNVWGSATPVSFPEELILPSGQTCLAKKMAIEAVIQTGLVSEVDILTQAVDKHTRMVKGGNKVPDGPVLDDGLLKDREALAAIVGLTDRLIPHIVVSPVVQLHWTEQTIGKTKVTKMIPLEDREPGVVYTDQIDFGDKMHLFEWSMGGLTAFSSFQRESPGDVGGVGSREGSRKSAKRRPRNR